MLITLDIETNTSHDTIWIAVTQNVETGEMLEHYSAETLEPLLRDSEGVIGHNIQVELGRQYEENPHRVQRDQKPLDPLKEILPASPRFQRVPGADAGKQEEKLHGPGPDQTAPQHIHDKALLYVFQLPALCIEEAGTVEKENCQCRYNS